VNKILIVFRKEVREMFRDKRVINGAFVMPVFVIVLMLFLFGFLQDTVRKKRPIDLYVVSATAPANALSEQILGKDALIKTVPSLDEGRRMVRDGDAKVVIEFAPDFGNRIAAGAAPLKILFDETSPLSQLAMRDVVGKIDLFNRTRAAKTLESKGISPAVMIPIAPSPENVSKPTGLNNEFLISLLPYLIIIWAFYGGFSIVSDLVAGEKERGTLETLLISPAHRNEICLGKFLALAMVCLASSLISVVAVFLFASLPIPMIAKLFPQGMSVSLPTIAAVIAVLLPLVASFAGLLLAVSALAKNMREAQTYLTLVSFVVLMPAIFSQFLGFTDLTKSTWVRFVPILNTAVDVRSALTGKIEWGWIGVTVAISLGIAAVMLFWVVRLFQKEQILTRV